MNIKEFMRAAGKLVKSALPDVVGLAQEMDKEIADFRAESAALIRKLGGTTAS